MTDKQREQLTGLIAEVRNYMDSINLTDSLHYIDAKFRRATEAMSDARDILKEIQDKK